MIVGTVREIKDNEYRVGLTPGGVSSLVHDGHTVLVEQGAGEGSGILDEQYQAAGATIVSTAAEVWERADLVVKVKEPQPEEYPFLRPSLTLFTYLHLAASESLTRQMLKSGVVGVAYETVELADGSLPLLEPMSEIAGRMSVQVAAHYLEKMNGGRGKLLGGVPGVQACDVVIIGGGTVGTNAAQVALGMGAHVTVLDIDLERLRYLSHILHGHLTTLNSDPHTIASCVSYADVVIGAVLIKGGKAPKLVTREMVSTMKPGSVIIDVAVDQGGCIETSRPTTHSHPTFVVDGVVHYCVANMPGAVPRTSTFALANATIPYVRQLAALGPERAIKSNAALARGVNVYHGRITYRAVAEAFGLPYEPLPDN
ncbi:MAG: alanine dehydrogenase [Anaerolineae bacterium]